MNKGIENLVRGILKTVAPNYEIVKFNNAERMDTDSANKIDIYELYVTKLMQKIQLINQEVEQLNELIKSEESVGLYKIQLQKQVVDLELELMNLEVELLAKKYYISTYNSRIEIFKEKQKKIYEESKKDFDDFIKCASSLITIDAVSKKDKEMLSGIISKYHSGLKDIEVSNQLYLKLRGHVIRINNELNKMLKEKELI